MSANNWRECPNCKAKKETRERNRRLAAAAVYGKVSAEEYAKILARDASPNKGRDELYTLREDWELGLGVDGHFRCHYLASCEKCGFEFSHKHSEIVNIPANGEQ